MDDTTGQRAADAVVLHLTRSIVDEHGAWGDERLVAELRRQGVDERHARASLARLETEGHVSFDGHGWTAPHDAPSSLLAYASAV